MPKEYNYLEIEKKWQNIWDKEKTFKTLDKSNKPKYYALIEFPYPSGVGLHIGHPRPYTALDIVARKKRLDGYNVLFPIGWDAFGLPTENYAIKNKIHPEIVTRDNIANFRRQLKSLGLSFDWDREVNTTDPKYYRWTQWIFLQMFKKGLAYKKQMPVNWCNSCKAVLANEEVVNGVCERCEGEVVQRNKNQWMMKITEYADRLIDDLKDLDYINRVKSQQINWIGRSEGLDIDFKLSSSDDVLRVFTTRPDTLYGATYMVISPEHPYVEKYKNVIQNINEVIKYQEDSLKKSDFERTELNKEKTGVQLKGLKAINPLSNEEIPIFISDYVLMSYGTGAIMAVPAHDERDWEFAKKFDLPITEVVEGGNVDEAAFTDTQTGVLVNSGQYSGLSVKEAIKKISYDLEKRNIADKKINYKLRDWIFSRQRYWGEPIPVVHCDKCNIVALDESELPLLLPKVESYEPNDIGESPLANLDEWVNTTCPKCGGHAKRETDTMPQWAGSCWYFLRYIDPSNDESFANRELLDYWLPVDWYNGGMEHTTLHLLYSRFWYKFLFDIDEVPTKEPYKKRTSHGMILGTDGEKMSKSKGNGVNPDEIINEFGTDALRMYEMFIGDFEKSVPWSTNGVIGCKRFLNKVWNLQDNVNNAKEEYSHQTLTSVHKCIKKVTNDFETLKFNTAIASMMSLTNEFIKLDEITKADYQTLLILLNPVSPHITEELWNIMGYEGQISQKSWLTYDEDKTKDNEIELVLQVNGKVRNKITVQADLDKEDASNIALSDEKVLKHTQGKDIVKTIVIPNKLVNIVVK